MIYVEMMFFILPGIINYTCLLLGSDILKAKICKNKRSFTHDVTAPLFQRAHDFVSPLDFSLKKSRRRQRNIDVVST